MYRPTNQGEITQEVAAEAQCETAVGDEDLSFGQLEAEPDAEPLACGEIPSNEPSGTFVLACENSFSC